MPPPPPVATPSNVVEVSGGDLVNPGLAAVKGRGKASSNSTDGDGPAVAATMSATSVAIAVVGASFAWQGWKVVDTSTQVVQDASSLAAQQWRQ